MFLICYQTGDFVTPSGASSKEYSIIMAFDGFQGDEIRQKLVQNFMAKNENLCSIFD